MERYTRRGAFSLRSLPTPRRESLKKREPYQEMEKKSEE